MSNFKTVVEFKTLLEGYDYCRENGPIPFVVRDCQEFNTATANHIRNQINLETSLHGYNETGTHKVSGRIAYDKWSKDTLDFNIVDSSSSRGTVLLPLLIRDLNIANDIDVMLWLSYVLTLACVQSKVHIDPPFGSGWQFLSEGSKEWTIIDKDFFSDKQIVTLPIVPVAKVDDVIVAIPIIPTDLDELVPIAQLQFMLTTTTKFSSINVNPNFKVVLIPLDLPIQHVDLDSIKVLSAVVPVILPTLPDLVPVIVLPILPVITTTTTTPDATRAVEDKEDSKLDLDFKVIDLLKYPTAYIPTVNYDVEQLSQDYPQQLYRTTLYPNDFISCPENWPHSVYTSVKTCGLSGYMRYDKQ